MNIDDILLNLNLIIENTTGLQNNDNNNDINKNAKNDNVYINNNRSNKLMPCNCAKTAKLICTNKTENTSPAPIKNENYTCKSSAQYWHSVGEINKRKQQADFGCQCAFQKKDLTTQDNSLKPEDAIKENHINNLEKCTCTDSAVNTDTQINSCIPNIFCSLSNDPIFHEAMQLMHSPNVVVLSHGCSCCNKCNCPLERTSVTTNTSDIIVTTQEKNDKMGNMQEQNQDQRQESTVTFPKNNRMSRDLSIVNNEQAKTRSIKDTPQNVNNNDLLKDTTFMVPEETNYTVGSALVNKNGKKKATPKSKKRKCKVSSGSKESNEKRDSINIYCQTDKKLPEEKLAPELPLAKNSKDASVCCNINTCKFLPPKNGQENLGNTVVKNQNTNKCDCTDIQNFITIITELCAQMNKIKEKTNGNCDCCAKNTTTKTPEAPDVTTPSIDCLEIHRLAERIADIHLKSNHNKIISRNEFRRSVDVQRSTNSDCDLTNCPNIQPTNIPSDNAEECYCTVCSCKKTTKYDKKDVFPVKKEKGGRSSINPNAKRESKKLNDFEYGSLNKWTQQYPLASPQKCTCNNFECLDLEEMEMECMNYNISDYSKDGDNCTIETCPQLRRIMKECLCETNNCYCHNAKLNEMKTTAKLERLADEVISAISPCNCGGQQCTCSNNNINNNVMDSGFRRFTTRQVCFSSIYNENQRKMTNNTGK